MKAFSLLCGTTFIVATSPASAGDLFPPIAEQSEKPGVYVSGGGAVKTFTAPSYHGSYSNVADGTGASDDRFAIDFDQRMILTGFEGEVGVVLPDEKLPDVFGQDVRLSVSGRNLTGSRDELGSASFSTSGNNSVDGTNGSVNVLAINHVTYVDVEQDETAYDVSMASDFQLSGSFSLTPSINVMYAKAGTHVHTRNKGNNDLVVQDFFLESRDFGGTVGIAGTYAMTPWLDLGIGGQMGLVKRVSKMDASDCGQGGGVTSVFGSCSGAAWRTGASDRDTATPWLGGIDLGVRAHAEAWSVALNASMDYDSKVASFRTPTGTETEAASITYDDRFSYGGMLQITYTFN